MTLCVLELNKINMAKKQIIIACKINPNIHPLDFPIHPTIKAVTNDNNSRIVQYEIYG